MAAIFIGGTGWTLADYYAAAVNALPGDPVGFTTTVFCRVDTQAVASTSRRLFGQRGTGNPGWNYTLSGTNSSMTLGVGNASGQASSPASSVVAADVGRLLLYQGTWEGTTSTVRLYAKRVQVGAGSSLPTGYAPDTAVAPMIGRRAPDSPADGVTIFGVTYALGIATLAQLQAQYDAVMANERMQGVPGLPGLVIDLTADIQAAGGTMPATLTDRGTLGVSFTKTGNPQLAPMYSRAWAA